MSDAAVMKKEPAETFTIALMSDGMVVRLEPSEEVPDESTTFGSLADLMKLRLEDLDRISMKLLKAQIPASRTKAEAASRAWTTLLAASANPPVKESTKEAAKKASKLGNSKFKLGYDFDSPAKTDEDRFKELPPQAQTCLKIMEKGGKKEYDEADLRKLVEENGKEFKTVQPPWRIFQYYKRVLRDNDFLSW